MTRRSERIERLRRDAQERSADATARVRRAIIKLERGGQAITFVSVANEARVSRSFLYNNVIARSLVESKRTAPSANNRLNDPEKAAGEATKLAVVTQALRALQGEVRVLREENARLRGDLAALRRSSSR